MVGITLSVLYAAAGFLALAGVSSVQAQSPLPSAFDCPATDLFPGLLCNSDLGSSAPGNRQSIVCYYSSAISTGGAPNEGRNGCPAGQIGSDGSDAIVGPNGESRFYCVYDKTSGELTASLNGDSCPETAAARSQRARRRSAAAEAPSSGERDQVLKRRINYFRALEAQNAELCADVDTSAEPAADASKIQKECYRLARRN